MNPTPTEPTNEPNVPDENVTPVTPLTPFAPETPNTQLTPEAVPIEPMTLTTPEAEQAPAASTPIVPEVPVASSDVLFPSSPQPVPLKEATPFAPPSAESVVTPAPIGSGSTFASAPTSTPELKKSNKKLVRIAAIVGGALLLAIIGALVYASIATVSAKDYQEAVTQYNKASVANSALASDVAQLTSNLGTDSDEEFKTSLTEAEKSLVELKDESAKLGELKAVRVGEGKDLYTTFDTKMATYVTYAGDIIESVKKAQPAIAVCDKVKSAPDKVTGLAALQDCSTKLTAVGDLPNAEFKAYIASIGDLYAKYAVNYQGLADLTDPFGAQYERYKTYRDGLSATTKGLSTASKDYTAAIKKHNDEVSVKDSAQALGKYLSEQQKS